MDDFKISILKEEDIKEYLSLIYKLSKYKCNIIKEINIDNRYIYIIKNNQNNIIGTGTLYIINKVHCDNVGLIEDVIIEEKYRKKGLGYFLIKHLKNKAINSNCYKIMLDCKEHNIIFYKKNNFEIIGYNMAYYPKD